MPKEWTKKQAEQDFNKRILPLEDHLKGHKPKFKWDDKGRYGRSLEVRCAKGCDMYPSYWYGHANSAILRVRSIAYGRLSTTGYKTYNNHLINLEPEVTVVEEPLKVLHVTLSRVEHEWWVAHYKTDYIEELQAKSDEASLADGYDPYKVNWQNKNSWYRGSGKYPWVVVKKDSQGWKRQGVYPSKEAAVSAVLDRVDKYRAAGNGVEVYTPDVTVGVEAPIATIHSAVKKLVNGFKELPEKATPIETKKYLAEVDDALSQMTILESLREEVQERFMESLEL